MRILVDIGNSRFKWRSEDEPHVGGVVDYHQHNLREYLDEAWLEFANVISCWACSVANQALRAILEDWCLNHWEVAVNWVQPMAQQLGVNSLYESPDQLGADRWVALIGARNAFPDTALCVIDVGTAVTVDALAANGDFLGGVIIPGKALMRAALGHNTAQISTQLDASPQFDVQARNTDQAVLTGVELTLNAGVTRIIQEHLTKYQSNMKLILTGGGASGLTLPYAGIIERPGLVFEGLGLIAQAVNNQ